jgi:hypothetical protein
MLVPRYKLSLSHTPIKPDLLGFSGIGVFACGSRDHVITRFRSVGIKARLRNKVISFYYFCFFSVPLSFSVFAIIFLFFVL